MDDAAPRVLPIPLAGIILGLLLAAAAAVFLTATAAHAEVTGPCSATIAGADVAPLDSGSTGDAVEVDVDSDIIATMSAQQGFRSHQIKLRFLGNVIPARTVESRTDSGEPSFTETVHVSDYAWAGVGLYKVSGVATLSDGTRCTGAALVKVTGRNPLTTVAGGVAAGVTVLGTVGGLASGVAAAAGNARPLSAAEEAVNTLQEASEADERRRRADVIRERMTRPETPNAAFLVWLMNWWACICLAALSVLLVPLMTLMGTGGQGKPPTAVGAAVAPPPRLPRAPWGPRITLVGLIGGVLAGAGVLVLLQQFAVVYPTKEWAICLLALGAAVYGLVLPTIGYTIGWARVNGKVDRMERDLGWS